ncbi:hypothetical protein [uncultured Sphingobacterium sp.]|jgi:hypothetical protein|uniref:hypothetical protein n=1 Tax=uncultured Sphingobacterium sp. TaxID=182688 RepID=UPI0037480A39
MKFLFPVIFIVSFFIGCKKNEEKENGKGTITVNKAIYAFDKGSKQTSIGNLIVDGKLVDGINHLYTFSSAISKNNIKLLFFTRNNQLSSGSYFINSVSTIVKNNAIDVSYKLEEDYGQTDRINVTKGTLVTKKYGNREILEFETNAGNRITLKWDGEFK